MIEFLRKKYIKDYKNISDENVRVAHGILASILGIIINVILFITKLSIGILSFSVSIIADSINNLSDFSSSIVTLIGFKAAGKPADKDHPYGHERIEYVTGLILSLIIIFIGGILAYTSISKIINYNYEPINYTITYISIGILAFAIIMKILQFHIYNKISKIISSEALKATATDSFNDCIATIVILIGMVLIVIFEKNNIKISFSIDGILGILVSIFIIISGILLLQKEITPLIGKSISKEFIEELEDYIKSYDYVLGCHDLICHMYGPTVCYCTVHVELNSELSFKDAHDMIDKIERDVKGKYNIDLTIHMDPILLNDEEFNSIKNIIITTLNKIDSNIKYHDIHMNNDDNETIYFDILFDFDNQLEIEEIKNKIIANLKEKTRKNYKLIIEVDHPYSE